MEMERMKKIAMIFLACTAGAVALQLVLPMLLGMLVNGLPFVGAFVIYDVLIRRRQRASFPESEEGAETPSEEADGQSGKESRKSKKPEAEGAAEQEAKNKKKRQEAADWYENAGRERIQGIVSNLYARGIYECWIRKDGICYIRAEKRYRRAGSLPGFSWDYADTAAELLRQEGLNAVLQKASLYLAWAEE